KRKPRITKSPERGSGNEAPRTIGAASRAREPNIRQTVLIALTSPATISKEGGARHGVPDSAAMTGRPSLLFRASWFVRSRPILLRRWLEQRMADWGGAASGQRARQRWSGSDFAASLPDLIWTRPRVVREYLHEMASGNPRCDWVTWMMHRYAVGTELTALVLG